MASRRAATVVFTLLALILAAATLSTAYPADVTTGGVPSRKGLRKDYLPANPFCPRDAVKFAACAGVLGAVGTQVGEELLGNKCCELVRGLTAAEAAACLCVAAKESVLGAITAEWSVGVGLLASACKKELPDEFKCV